MDTARHRISRVICTAVAALALAGTLGGCMKEVGFENPEQAHAVRASAERS